MRKNLLESGFKFSINQRFTLLPPLKGNSIIFKVSNIERFRIGSDGINTSANYINVTSPNFISYSGTGELADASRQGWGSRFFNSRYWPF